MAKIGLTKIKINFYFYFDPVKYKFKGAETLVLGETGVGLFPSIYFFGVG